MAKIWHDDLNSVPIGSFIYLFEFSLSNLNILNIKFILAKIFTMIFFNILIISLGNKNLHTDTDFRVGALSSINSVDGFEFQ